MEPATKFSQQAGYEVRQVRFRASSDIEVLDATLGAQVLTVVCDGGACLADFRASSFAEGRADLRILGEDEVRNLAQSSGQIEFDFYGTRPADFD